MKMHSTKTLPNELKMHIGRLQRSTGAIFLFASLFALATLPGRAAAAPAGESVANEPLVTLTDFTPGVVLDGRAMLLGHYNPSNMLRLAVVLKPAHPEEARQYLEDLQDKNSPDFHQFLEPEQWADRFGPTREAEQAVVDWAQKSGFTVTYRYNHRISVDLEAPAGVIEKALHITINRYQVPALNGHDGHVAFSNDRDPQLPASIARVVDGVMGLSSVAVLLPASGSGRVVPQPDYTPGPAIQHAGSAQQDADPDAVRALNEGHALGSQGTSPPTGDYWPSDYFSPYGYDYGALMRQGHCCNPNHTSGHSPRESSIAIAGFGDFSFNDISGFHAGFPYLAYYVDKYPVDGGYACNNSGGYDDNCTEVTMDTEWSLAMANSEGTQASTARVAVYTGPGFGTGTITDVYNHMADDAHARTTSVSFAYVESDGSEFSNSEMETLDSDVFAPMVGMGWTLLGASGDHGATGGCDDGLRVMFPASDPNFVAVGGTLYAMYTLNPEVAWTGSQQVTNDVKICGKNNGGGTGGFSELFGVPGYQSGMGFSMRSVPDMSLDSASAHAVYVDNGWANLGGTSVASPMLAGFFAQANAYLLSIGDKCGSNGKSACAPIGNANYPIYAEGKSEVANKNNQAGHVPFYDITEGCNSNGLTVQYSLPAWCAQKGYDQATGWGSANMLQLAWAINWELAAATGIPYTTFSGPATNKWYNTNQTVTWKIHDFSGGSGIPGTGIAGQAQAWDSIGSDPSSELRGQLYGLAGNFFYSGPQFVNGSTGCLAFTPNGCSALSGSNAEIQGCHTVHVRGWNNQGWDTGDSKYGPLCYDTIPPVSGYSISASSLTSIKITLAAQDPGFSNHTGSGVAKIYYSVDKASCSATGLSNCTVYTKPFTLSPGTHTLLFFSVDNAGNFEKVHNKTIFVS